MLYLTMMAVRSLNFSIENILSPEFGKISKETNNKSHRSQHSQQPIDFSSLTNKRKHSSDSESSSISSLSITSKDIINGKCHYNNSSNKSKTSSPDLILTPPLPNGESNDNKEEGDSKKNLLWPAWVYCTRYSDRPSSGPRSRKMKKKEKKPDEKRPRTAFTAEQLARLKQEFQENRYLTEQRRQSLAKDLKLNESQIKIWFQNKRAKIKKSTGSRNPLALHLMAQGLYNHSTVPIDGESYDEDSYDDRTSSCTSPPVHDNKSN